MASTTILRRPLHSNPTPRRTDEELINRSLLDSLDAQADAEPLSSSDSEASGAKSASGTNGSMMTSPPQAYAMGAMQSQLSRSDSPSLLPHRNQPQHGIDSYLQHTQNPAQPVYNSMHPSSDFSPSSTDNATPKQFEKTGFSSFRTPTAYNNTFVNNRPRHSTSTANPANFRDAFPSYASSAESFASAPPVGPQQSFDNMHPASRAFDFGSPPASAGVASVHHKASFSNIDPFTSAMAQSHLQAKTGTTTGPRQHGGYHGPAQPSFGGALSAIHSQTPFGPHLPAAGANGMGSAGMGPVSASVQNTTQEEISTIFVVGFPDDMQEREFQNMFTFSPGFEAATLKIPNKELTSYGPGAGNLRSAGFAYSGSNDPYNLVTMNQGGVLVDNGRDGTTTSWGAAMPHDEGHFSNGPNMAPRKQIIGFAKFRSRQEALDAREVLQGRRVDAEKGAVLKAEMAKKNLHTKRGVGQGGVSSMMGGDGLTGIAGMNGLGGMGSPTLANAEALSARERELGALGAMGFSSLGPRRERAIHDQDDERERAMNNVHPMQGMLGSRGPRERAEDDERERERRRREKEQRLRSSNSSAFDAFHSVPHQLGRNAPVNPLLEDDGYASPGFGMTRVPVQDHYRMNGGMDPWSPTSRDGLPPAPPIRKAPSSLSSANFAMRHSDSQQGSPTNFDEFPSGPNSTSSQDGFDSDTRSNPDPAAYPDNNRAPFMQRGFHPRAASPQADHGHSYYMGSHQAPSSASSTSGSSQIGGEEFMGSMAALALSTQQGEISPQLPSPVSNASSGSAPKGNVDQNPPINTLYVGNLPSSPLLSYSNQLEESLKALFSRCQGFRKLCFRQKSNGPMCFVEFEDVSYATKALNDLYGHTLDGMIKNGGIRLSYSKNPLGVRTPTGTSGAPPHQQSLSNEQSPYLADAFQTRQQQGHMADVEHASLMRRDSMTVTSPTTAYHHYNLSPPPPRFFAPSPAAAFTNPGTPLSSTAFPRANPQGYSLPSPGSGGASPFASFGLPAAGRAADQTSMNDNTDHIIRTLPPLTT